MPADNVWDDVGARDLGGGARLEENKRIARVLEIIQLVAAQPQRWRRVDLADRFEVSQRQIDKDLQLVRHGLKLPLRHVATGYWFESLPQLAAAPLTFEEALALILAAQAARQVVGIDSADLAAAITRLEAQFPLPLRDLLQGAGPDVPLDPGAVHRKHVLSAIERAIAARRKVRIAYASATRGGALTERTVQPYALLQYVRSWHVVAYCELREDVRMFKVDRIRDLWPADDAYAFPADFDLAAYRGEGWGILRTTDLPAERVELLFDDQAGRWVGEERWHPRQSVEVRDDGRVYFRVEVPVTPELVRWVLGYGRHVTVVSPESLRDEVAAEAKAVIAAEAE